MSQQSMRGEVLNMNHKKLTCLLQIYIIDYDWLVVGRLKGVARATFNTFEGKTQYMWTAKGK